MNSTRVISMALAAVLMSGLTACGGGGGGGGGTSGTPSTPAPPPATSTVPPTAPVLTISATNPGELSFSWPAVSGATYYQLHKSADGLVPYVQLGGNLSTTSATETISALNQNWADARYKLAACNAGGCTDSATMSSVSAMLNAIAYLKAANQDAGDWFGSSVDVSADGNTLVIGAEHERSSTSGINSTPNNSCIACGAVYVFVRNGATWVQQAYIKASNPDPGDAFGWPVLLSDDGNTLAVGAINEDSSTTGINGDGSNNAASLSGAAYVFVRSGTTWTQQAYIKASNTQASDMFNPIALSGDGNTLVAGASSESSDANGIGGLQSDNSAPYAGAAYVFVRNGTTWTQQAYLKAADSRANSQFGFFGAISTDGNTLVVGAAGESSSTRGINTTPSYVAPASSSGAAYVFTRSGTTWSQQAYIKPPNSDAGDRFGMPIALSADGNTLAVGAPNEDSNARTVGGDQGNNSAGEAGAAYIYSRSGSTWSFQAYLKALNADAGDGFPTALSLSPDGNLLAASSKNEAGGSVGVDGDPASNSKPYAGAVYLFSRSGTTWSQRQYVKAPNTDSGDLFGHSVALDGSGRLYVGAPLEAGASAGIGGDPGNNSALEAGAAYVY